MRVAVACALTGLVPGLTIWSEAVVGDSIPSAAADTALTVTWAAVHPGTAPPALRDAAAAYDADTSTVVLFGGLQSDGSLSDSTWVWDGQTWSDHLGSSTQTPPARQNAAMAFDPSLHQLILFGGQGKDGAMLGDTWAWNGVSWYQLAPGPAGSPGAREGAALALDPAGDLVLFGGAGAGPVAAGVTTTTTPATGTPPGPPTSTAGAGAPATPAPPAAQLLGDTWQWTAKGWAPSKAAGPSPRWGSAMAYDSTDHTTVLFSGDTAAPGSAAQTSGDTWTWDGTAWAAQSPAASPGGRFGAAMTDDPSAGGTLLAGGEDSAGVVSDSWVWDGSNWTSAGGAGPAARAGAAAAFSKSASSAVIFGGAGPGGAALGDTEIVTTAAPSPSPLPTATTTPASGTGPAPATRPQGGSSPVPPAHLSPTITGQPTSSTTSEPGTSSSDPGGSSAVASAPPYMTLQTNVENVHQGGPVQLAGSGFQPGTPITITFRSTPLLVGRILAGPHGDFTATVSVPRSASPGEHHFTASGRAPDGRTTTLLASIFVLPPASHTEASPIVKVAMVGLALLIPGGAWLAMSGAGWWRRRPRPQHAGRG